jgi:hypothetical protein
MTRRTARRWLLAAGVGIALIAVAFMAGLLREPPSDRRPHPFNHDRNAVWLEHRWLTQAQPRSVIEAKVRALARHGVLYVFPHLIPFEKSGRLPPHEREQMRAFLETARAVAPRVQVLPWVGGLRLGYRRTRTGTIDLADLGQRQRIVAECRGLLDEGFDGIHLNIEPVPNGDDDFLALLRALRPAMGAHGVLSVSATRLAPVAIPMLDRFAWTAGYYSRVAAEADQVVVMAYDTALPSSGLYRRYVSYAAKTSTRVLEPITRARVLIGVPTYDATGLMHRPGVETLENALLGIVSGLRGAGGGGTFEGVALYADWTTTPDEWSTYEHVWRGGARPAQ